MSFRSKVEKIVLEMGADINTQQIAEKVAGKAAKIILKQQEEVATKDWIDKSKMQLLKASVKEVLEELGYTEQNATAKKILAATK